MHYFIFFLACCLTHKVAAQYHEGSKAYSMGGATVAVDGKSILLGNPASQKVDEFLFSTARYSTIRGLNRLGFAAHKSHKQLSIETGVQRFGDLLASSDLIYAGFSHKIGPTSLGLRINLDQFRAEGFNTIYNFSFSAGGITRLTKSISFGAYADRLSWRTAPENESIMPVRLVAGLAFDLSSNLTTAISFFQELNEVPALRTGLEYKAAPSVKLRVGNSFFPAGIFAGTGVTYWKLVIDLAGSYRQHEGLVIQATAGYRYNQ